MTTLHARRPDRDDVRTIPALVHLLAPLSLVTAAGGQATFVSLGELPGGSDVSVAYAVSDNGRAVGQSSSSNGIEAFLYDGIIFGLGDLPAPGFWSIANGISGDGTTAVGFGDGPIGGLGAETQAFRWTLAEGMVGLGMLPGAPAGSIAFAASADGSVIVGSSSSANTGAANSEAFRWTPGAGMVGLGDLPGFVFNSRAHACSSDGAIVVGYATGTNVPLGREAFWWSAETGMVPLGTLPGGGKSEARAVSDVGDVVVGLSSAPGGQQAFRWSAGTMTGLGDLGGGTVNSTANDVSADGSVVVGRGRTEAGDRAFIWTEATGIRDLRGELMVLGVFEVVPWTLTDAFGISSDGKTIVGRGIDAAGKVRGWMVANYGEALPPPLVMGDLNGDGFVNAADLGILLAAWGPCAADNDCPADMNGDGQVGGADMGVLLGQWG